MLYKKNNAPKLDPELFKQPTAEYRGTPFWAWNCKLEKEELEYYRNRKEFMTEIKRYVLVAVPYSEKPAWYVDEEDMATVGSTVEVDYGIHQDIHGVVIQVLRCDKHYPPYSGRIKPIWEIVELKEEKPRF